MSVNSFKIQRKLKSGFFEFYIYSCLFICFIVFTLSILKLGMESFSFFQEVSPLKFFTEKRWAPLFQPQHFGIAPLLNGSLLIVLGSLIVALPLGLCCSIYLYEYSPKKIKIFLKPALETLSSIPSIVYGYLALSLITPSLKLIFPSIEIFNAASAMIIVGIMILPTIISLSHDALLALPKDLKESSLALGCTPFESIFYVLIPAIKKQIGAAAILASSRALGESMAVSIAAGSTPKLSLNPLEAIQTMTAFIVQLSLGDIAHGSMAQKSCYSIAFMLFLTSILLNSIAHRLIRKEAK